MVNFRPIDRSTRLKHECDLSYGQIAQALRISKATVANYLVLAEAVGVTHRVALGLDDVAAYAAALSAAPRAAALRRL